MKVIDRISEMQNIVMKLKCKQKIGFVPTMGFLHEGHRKCIHEARIENDVVIVSIFVNPLQFGENEDFNEYPRDLVHDRSVCIAEGVDYIFTPSIQEMYPNRMSAKITVQKRTNVLCGKSRPGHFDGVATVLTKLFHIIQPDKLYMGMKDAQQVAVVSGLITDFNFPIQLVRVDTVREEDGLAKSSRNVNLTEQERNQAPILYKSLKKGAQEIALHLKSEQEVLEDIRCQIEDYTSGVVDYIHMLTYPELEEIQRLEGDIIIALAVKFSKTRLIDNVVFTVEAQD